MTIHEDIHGEGYEDGIQEGLRMAHASALRSESRCRATVQAYRWLVRDARLQVAEIRQALPPELASKLAGIEGLLEKLSHAEVSQ